MDINKLYDEIDGMTMLTALKYLDNNPKAVIFLKNNPDFHVFKDIDNKQYLYGIYGSGEVKIFNWTESKFLRSIWIKETKIK